MHAINVLCNLPGIGWERAEAILKTYGSVSEFLQEAQVCLDSGNLSTLENIKINGRRFGKSAHKMFQVDGIWRSTTPP
jgi:ERCC4-type nuclease